MGQIKLTADNKFSASGSLAGYLYQCRLALLLGLQTVKRKPNGHISIEKFDDIAFHDDNHAECLIQAKHHVTEKSLTDSSVDVWKTLRIWVQDFRSGLITNSETRRMLITTAAASEDSAMAMLRVGASKNQQQAARIALQAAAKASENETSKLGREVFLTLTDQEADLLLATIHVIDRSPNLSDVIDEIEGELRLLAPNHSDKVTEALEGWWLKIVAKRLVGDGSAQISLQDILKKANEIGSWYKPDGLPISDPEELGLKLYSPDDEDQIYVKQMRLVQLPESAIRRSVHDFYRSNAQRSRWVRESLLLDGEASRYDSKLRDQWERKFEAECTAQPDSDDDGKRNTGRGLYFWATQQEVGFRNVVETWITAGSFHSLSDRLEVGWHPEFKRHLGDSNGTS